MQGANARCGVRMAKAVIADAYIRVIGQNPRHMIHDDRLDFQDSLVRQIWISPCFSCVGRRRWRCRGGWVGFLTRRAHSDPG